MQVPSSQATALISSFGAFLTIAIHTILYHRSLYPRSSFLLARAYNLPVRQSRHPAVCGWVRDAVAAVTLELRRAAVRRVVLSVHEPGRHRLVLERWVFDLDGFPAESLPPPPGEMMGLPLEAAEEAGVVNWDDVHQSWRAALHALALRADMLPPTPEDCSFALALELRLDAKPPTRHPQLWIPSEPQLQPPSGPALPTGSTVPVRSVQAGPMFFECWLERAE
ncbi:hypothetical protein XA68_11521 [Ophiocordyceps unilateralis]|uniref:HORMA domain-containing protein n=1 Tax=Ophiocordyceps unilateralis TaxID=268505 RepID=A0A2A9PGN2_OPHUN|nr:hypothetical protein XA68_11521 [Ophiocordyceps unilateralis]